MKARIEGVDAADRIASTFREHPNWWYDDSDTTFQTEVRNAGEGYTHFQFDHPSGARLYLVFEPVTGVEEAKVEAFLQQALSENYEMEQPDPDTFEGDLVQAYNQIAKSYGTAHTREDGANLMNPVFQDIPYSASKEEVTADVAAMDRIASTIETLHHNIRYPVYAAAEHSFVVSRDRTIGD